MAPDRLGGDLGTLPLSDIGLMQIIRGKTLEKASRPYNIVG